MRPRLRWLEALHLKGSSLDQLLVSQDVRPINNQRSVMCFAHSLKVRSKAYTRYLYMEDGSMGATLWLNG